MLGWRTSVAGAALGAVTLLGGCSDDARDAPASEAPASEETTDVIVDRADLPDAMDHEYVGEVPESAGRWGTEVIAPMAQQMVRLANAGVSTEHWSEAPEDAARSVAETHLPPATIALHEEVGTFDDIPQFFAFVPSDEYADSGADVELLSRGWTAEEVRTDAGQPMLAMALLSVWTVTLEDDVEPLVWAQVLKFNSTDPSRDDDLGAGGRIQVALIDRCVWDEEQRFSPYVPDEDDVGRDWSSTFAMIDSFLEGSTAERIATISESSDSGASGECE